MSMEDNHTSTIIGLMAFTKPFRFVQRNDNDVWSITVDDANLNTYDHLKLHSISASLDIGLPEPYCMYVGFDGSLIVPPVKEMFYPHEKAVNSFNRILAELLLGGVFYEALDPVDVCPVRIYKNEYFSPMGGEESLIGRIHNALKMKEAADPFSRSDLLDPPTITWKELYDAQTRGRSIAMALPSASLELIVRGVSAFAVHKWAESLINLWVASEQMINALWTIKVIESGRQSSLSKKVSKELPYRLQYVDFCSST